MAVDPYQTLELERDATAQQIRDAYLRLARQHHPDHNLNDPTAADRFKQVQMAYEALVHGVADEEWLPAVPVRAAPRPSWRWPLAAAVVVTSVLVALVAKLERPPQPTYVGRSIANRPPAANDQWLMASDQQSPAAEAPNDDPTLLSLEQSPSLLVVDARVRDGTWTEPAGPSEKGRPTTDGYTPEALLRDPLAYPMVPTLQWHDPPPAVPAAELQPLPESWSDDLPVSTGEATGPLRLPPTEPLWPAQPAGEPGSWNGGNRLLPMPPDRSGWAPTGPPLVPGAVTIGPFAHPNRYPTTWTELARQFRRPGLGWSITAPTHPLAPDRAVYHPADRWTIDHWQPSFDPAPSWHVSPLRGWNRLPTGEATPRWWPASID